MGTVLLGGAMLDHTLVLSGHGVGLLQHPTIWAFLFAQGLLPFTAERAHRVFQTLPRWAAGVLSREDGQESFRARSEGLERHLGRETNASRALYIVLILLGFLCVAWNSIQNQRPLEFLGFDFWDSSNHAWGYWLSRVAKTYLWMLFFPAIIHCQAGILLAASGVIRDAAQRGVLRVQLFHSDGCGGFRGLIQMVLGSLSPFLLVATLLALGTFAVNGKLDVTTVGGLLLAVAVFLVLYAIPAARLRQAIRKAKGHRRDEISRAQDMWFSVLLASTMATQAQKDAASLIDSLGLLSARVAAVPDWPQGRTVVRLVGLAMGSPLLTAAIKALLAKYVPPALP
jgi:hypothetical protein